MGMQLTIKGDRACRLASWLPEETHHCLTVMAARARPAELAWDEKTRNSNVQPQRPMHVAAELSAHAGSGTACEHGWLYDEETGLAT